MSNKAKFNIGSIVSHKVHGYKALIIDVDPFFKASGRCNPQVYTRAFAMRNPWYRLAVENSSVITYVEESHLDLVSAVSSEENLLSELSQNNKKYTH